MSKKKKVTKQKSTRLGTEFNLHIIAKNPIDEYMIDNKNSAKHLLNIIERYSFFIHILMKPNKCL